MIERVVFIFGYFVAVCRLVFSEDVIPVLWLIGYRQTSKRKMKICRKQLLSANYWMTSSMTVTPTMWASNNDAVYGSHSP